MALGIRFVSGAAIAAPASEIYMTTVDENGKFSSEAIVLNTLRDVNIAAPAEGHALLYNNANSAFENRLLLTADISDFSTITDPLFWPLGGTQVISANVEIQGDGTKSIQLGGSGTPSTTFGIIANTSFSTSIVQGVTTNVDASFILNNIGINFNLFTSVTSVVNFNSSKSTSSTLGDKGRFLIQGNSQTAGLRSFIDIGGSAGGGVDEMSLIIGTDSVGNLEFEKAGTDNIVLTDSRIGAAAVGMQYAADYTANFTARSFIDKGYGDNHIGGQNVDSLVVTPTATEDGFVISWNDINSEYELVAGGGGGTWVDSLTTGDVSAIQNTATSDITGQTTTKTFDGLNWDIDVTGRASTGEVTFLNFTKTDTGTTSVFKVDINGQITSASNLNLSTTSEIQFGGTASITGDGTGDVTIPNGTFTVAGPLNVTSSGAIRIAGINVITTSRGIIAGNGTEAVPAFRFSSDSNTGMFSIGPDQLGFSTGAILGLSIDASQNVTIGNGNLTVDGNLSLTAANSILTIGSSTSGDTTKINLIGNNDAIPIFVSIAQHGNGDAFFTVDTAGGGTGDAYIKFSVSGGQNYAIGIDNSDSDLLKITNNGTSISSPSTGTELVAFSATGIGVFNTAPIAQPSAYTRNATIVEDKTLLASASATVTNNNNVLAALINDLQLLGWVG